MPKTKGEKKIFVLDTSVIIYEHNSILNFDEHDIGIPITVLEELDNFKKGNDTKNFEAREFIRLIDKLAKDQMLHQWNPINGKGKGNFKVVMDTGGTGLVDANKIFQRRQS
jgi:PhoH-like ATPase